MQKFLIEHGINEKKIAVAVSGGADSLALVLMAREQLTLFGYEIVALTVDHGLRPTSYKEAHYVAEIMHQHGIEHHILPWQGEKPLTGIEEAARKARYDLLTSWCKEHGYGVLMVAHHLLDQAETFLMRLQRGSGLDGLCAMHEVSERGGIKIVRPLLRYRPEVLKDYLRQKNIEWIEDESNKDEKFLRNRVRKFLPELARCTDITAERICEAVKNLQSAQDFISSEVAKIVRDKVRRESETVCSFEYKEYKKWHREVKYRILAELCRRVYVPRSESVLQIVAALDKLPFGGATLGGREIFVAYGRVWVVPELNSKCVASREKWKAFVSQYPQYKELKIPHKARIALLQNI